MARSTTLRLAALALAGLLAPALAAQPLQVRLDAGTFLYSEDQSLLEIYLSFGADGLPYERTPDGVFLATLPVRLELRPTASAAPEPAQREPVFSRDVDLQFQVADTTALTVGQVFVEQVREAVRPGEYELSVAIRTPGDGGALELRRDVLVPSYGAGRQPAMSSVQLASRITRADGNDTPFVKSGLVVNPNPDAFYGGDLSRVPYYIEVYRPPADAASEYTLLTYLSETNEPNPLPDHSRRVQRTAREVDVVSGSMSVADLPSGIYYLRAVVLDAANQPVVEQSKRLYVINPDVARAGGDVGALDYEATLYTTMGEEELEENLRHARVIATSREAEVLARLQREGTDEERREFLASFWRERDAQAPGAQNTARRAFYDRLRTVNERYREPQRQGFETQRGRVYLTYGPPTEIERRTFQSDALPHEIWHYDNIAGQGRSIFVFVDRYSSNQYDLVHSDVVGEVSVSNWQGEILR